MGIPIPDLVQDETMTFIYFVQETLSILCSLDYHPSAPAHSANFVIYFKKEIKFIHETG